MPGATEPNERHSILGISFDGLGVSGIVNEFLNVAAAAKRSRLRVLLDLGYEIAEGRTTDLGWAPIPAWVETIKCMGRRRPATYTQKIIEDARNDARDGVPVSVSARFRAVALQIAELLVTTFVKHDVRFLVIENGTLPDNPIFTEAVYEAIDEYGRIRGLGKYVLWRDHDLMWSTEPHFYGQFPYPGVRKPAPNRHIHYAVATEWMRARMRAWVPSVKYHVIPNRFFTSRADRPNRALRACYGIPAEDLIIARCTRIVPQKCIERDLRLLTMLQRRLDGMGVARRVCLFVTGPTGEDPQEFERLRRIEQELSLTGRVVWANGLGPFCALFNGADDREFSIRDLLMHSHLSSFLTSFDYEGFGNPPGEAMAAGVPFISTTYELYHEVYGNKGAIAPLWSISRHSLASELPEEAFVGWTVRVLLDAEYRAEVTKRNLDICRRFLSLRRLAEQLAEMFPDILPPSA